MGNHCLDPLGMRFCPARVKKALGKALGACYCESVTLSVSGDAVMKICE